MYSPTSITGVDLESGDKVLKASKILDNLDGVSRETKLLHDKITENKSTLVNTNQKLGEAVQSYRKSFMDL